jgi:hypothetical protein
LVDIFYPSTGAVFSREGVFQQPQAITPTENPLAREGCLGRSVSVSHSADLQ